MEDRREHTLGHTTRNLLVDNHVGVVLHVLHTTDDQLITVGHNGQSRDEPAIAELTLLALITRGSLLEES